MLHHNAFRELGGVTIAKGLRKKSKHCLYNIHVHLNTFCTCRWNNTLVCPSPVLNQLDKMKEMFDSVERFAGGPRSGLESLEKKWRQSAGGRTGCKRSACTYRSQFNILCCHWEYWMKLLRTYVRKFANIIFCDQRLPRKISVSRIWTLPGMASIWMDARHCQKLWKQTKRLKSWTWRVTVSTTNVCRN